MPTELVNWATVIAAAAAVYSILLSVRALRDAGESRKFAEADHARQERAQAALVLSSADILRRRITRHWVPALADDLQPSAREAIRWRDEAPHDVHLAEELVRRSSGVNLEVACFAELVYRKAGLLQLALRRLEHEITKLGAALDNGPEAPWRRRHSEALIHAHEVAVALDRLESAFPPEALMVGRKSAELTTRDASGKPVIVRNAALHREEFLQVLNSEVVRGALERAKVERSHREDPPL